MPVYYKGDLSAQHEFLLSQKQSCRGQQRIETKSVTNKKKSAIGRSNIEVSRLGNHEAPQRPAMIKNARNQATPSKTQKVVGMKNVEPLVHKQVGTLRPSRDEIYRMSQVVKEVQLVIGHDEASLQRVLSSWSSSSVKNAQKHRLASTGKEILTSKSTERKKKSTLLNSAKETLCTTEYVALGWTMSFPVGSGFSNLGNTCYLNSTLQALFHVPSFVRWLVSDDSHTVDCVKLHLQNRCLICPVSRTLHNSHKHSGSAVKPSEVYSKLSLICKHLERGSQEDAHEFLRYLLEGMDRSYLECYKSESESRTRGTTPIGKIFGGYIRTEVACLECGHVSTTFQHFQDLILDIGSASSVSEALNQYFATESLGDEYKCDRCKRRIAATKKFFLEKPPKVLCVQLKRFQTLGGKNNKHVSFDHWVDLEPYLHKSKGSQSLRYGLVSMILHHGYSTSCGHYTAVGLTSAGSYYLFDDSSVSPMLLNEVLQTNPYILMFELSRSSSASSPTLNSSSSEQSKNNHRIQR